MTYRGKSAGASLAAASLLLSACAVASTGSGGAGPGPGSTTGNTSLTVIAAGGTGTAPTIWTLTCDPPGGTHPKAAAACRQLTSGRGDPFADTPKDMQCSMIYGGAQKAHVFGTFEGRHVDTTFGRTNGCEVARWQRVSALLVLKGGVGLPR